MATRRPSRVPGYSEAQLGWVQRNRRAPRPARRLGEVLPAEDLAHATDARHARAVFEAINSVVDDDFRQCCRFDELRGRELVLLVEEEAFLYDMRSRWYARLKAQLERLVPQRRIERITFRAGAGGAIFPPPQC